MLQRPPSIASLVAVIAALGLGASLQASAQELPVPATEQLLLGAPDPAGPTTRGVVLADPQGQIEDLVGVGHLLAWTVRTPADTSSPASPSHPKTLPASTRVVVVDERGGTPLTIDFAGRWISGLHAFRGPAGVPDPQIAVRSCTSRKASSCTIEVLALTPSAPVTLRSRTSDRFSLAAYVRRIDSGQRLVLGKLTGRGKQRACLPRFSVRSLSGGGDDRRLPALPRHPDYPSCDGLADAFIYGRYVFAVVTVHNDFYGPPADFLYGFDLEGGKAARWRELRQTYSTSEYSDTIEIGPALTDDALYFAPVSTDDEGTSVSLAQVLLPRDVQRGPRKTDPVWSDAISTSTVRPCTIAATDDAIYELTGPRCSYGTGTDDEIRRVVNPEFKAYP